MKELDNYLNEFQTTIDGLVELSPSTKNIRLGGSLILKLHGLNFSRPIGDLDIIITNPTEKQKNKLNELFSCDNIEVSYYTETNYKIKKNNFVLNILLVDNYLKPIEYVCYFYNGKYYGIIPINEIIDAKKSYGRKKDVNDFLLLKNENFNM